MGLNITTGGKCEKGRNANKTQKQDSLNVENDLDF